MNSSAGPQQSVRVSGCVGLLSWSSAVYVCSSSCGGKHNLMMLSISAPHQPTITMLKAPTSAQRPRVAPRVRRTAQRLQLTQNASVMRRSTGKYGAWAQIQSWEAGGAQS
jgi:hypothetical protein